MGCDIHCFIEYRNKNAEPNWQRWNGFGGKINPGRNYGIFALLAGVRNYNELKPISEPRGIDDNISFEAQDSYWMYIKESGEKLSENEVFRTKAEEWVEEKYSVFRKTASEKDLPKWVSNPDWHSHSWCSADELQSVIEHEAIKDGGYLQEYKAILAAMRSFEQSYFDVRLIFWFDN